MASASWYFTQAPVIPCAVQTIPSLKCKPASQYFVWELLENLPGCTIYGLRDMDWQMGVIPSVWMGISRRWMSGEEASANILVAQTVPRALLQQDVWGNGDAFARLTSLSTCPCFLHMVPQRDFKEGERWQCTLYI